MIKLDDGSALIALILDSTFDLTTDDSLWEILSSVAMVACTATLVIDISLDFEFFLFYTFTESLCYIFCCELFLDCLLVLESLS